MSIGAFGGAGGGNGLFKVPTGIAVDPSGHIHVFDSGNHVVQVFTNTGTFVTQWGGAIPFPSTYRGIEFDADGNLAMADPEMNQVRIFLFW